MAADEPMRYDHGEIECVDAVQSALSPEEFRGWCKGNIFKYIWREKHKGGDVDALKAYDYLVYLLADNCDRGEGSAKLIDEWVGVKSAESDDAPYYDLDKLRDGVMKLFEYGGDADD